MAWAKPYGYKQWNFFPSMHATMPSHMPPCSSGQQHKYIFYSTISAITTANTTENMIICSFQGSVIDITAQAHAISVPWTCSVFILYYYFPSAFIRPLISSRFHSISIWCSVSNVWKTYWRPISPLSGNLAHQWKCAKVERAIVCVWNDTNLGAPCFSPYSHTFPMVSQCLARGFGASRTIPLAPLIRHSI